MFGMGREGKFETSGKKKKDENSKNETCSDPTQSSGKSFRTSRGGGRNGKKKGKKKTFGVCV